MSSPGLALTTHSRIASFSISRSLRKAGGFSPRMTAKDPCGSASITRTRNPRSAKQRAMVAVVVDLADPPRWLAMTIRIMPPALAYDGRWQSVSRSKPRRRPQASRQYLDQESVLPEMCLGRREHKLCCAITLSWPLLLEV